jgi:hypothetical protein
MLSVHEKITKPLIMLLTLGHNILGRDGGVVSTIVLSILLLYGSLSLENIACMNFILLPDSNVIVVGML